MAMFSLRLEDDLAARFDAAARVHGGRSARLRQLVAGDAGPALEPGVLGIRRTESLRLMLRLRGQEAAFVTHEADAMGLARATWVAALVARRAQAGLPFSKASERTLIAVHGEIRRIGVNVNQIARALNAAVMEGRVLELELASLEALRRELRDHLQAVQAGMAGNFAYWEAGA